MGRVFAFLLLLVTITFVYLLDNNKHHIPGLGKMLSPTHGVWNNAPAADKANQFHQVIKTPDGNVDVYYDERRVPHIFAPNEKALYFAQGYVQASDRLWQMDFQVRVAAGRLSEAIGEDGLTYDRYFRRIGIPKAADDIVEALNTDTLYQKVVTSYTAGINAYISKLSSRNYPIEFKLADYAPEPWTLRKSVLLLKLMAFRLSGSDTDVANTNTLQKLGMETFNELFPDFPTDQSPIIPSSTRWKFNAVDIPVSQFEMDEIETDEAYSIMQSPLPQHKVIGSNNWAVGKDKTADGGAILCNDPHLGLTFPSIWYEMQLHAPGLNVYGVTIPGSPCIIIGYNEEIAWGVTNGSRDVRDWYNIRYKDNLQSEYLFEGEYHAVEERIERISVKDGQDVIDTVKWTAVGPIVFDGSFGKQESNKGLAVRWLALDVSNELKAFYYLNKAANHDDYLSALENYDNPAQNFVFADRLGNVAIKEQGKFRAKTGNTGKFVEALDAQSHKALNTFIPHEHNPHVLNPPRGFVSSANQHPTDSTYPYQYSGWFERYRNRRINGKLELMDEITVEDMMLLQNDTYNLMAQEMLPFLLGQLKTAELDGDGAAIRDSLASWDYDNTYTSVAPSYFQHWFTDLKKLVWDEIDDSTQLYRIPLDYETYEFLVNNGDHDLIDHQETSVKETVEMLVQQSFANTVEFFSKVENTDARWQYYNGSKVEHLMGLQSLSQTHLPIGGCENSINANIEGFGPSWRMIVRLNDEGIEGFGVYPGGPSGNPSDPNYNSFIDEWAEGTYFPLNFYKTIEEAEKDQATQ